MANPGFDQPDEPAYGLRRKDMARLEEVVKRSERAYRNAPAAAVPPFAVAQSLHPGYADAGIAAGGTGPVKLLGADWQPTGAVVQAEDKWTQAVPAHALVWVYPWCGAWHVIAFNCVASY